MVKLFLKIVGLLGGSLVLGIVVLILLGGIAWWLMKRKVGGFFGKAALAAMPPAIHLAREREPQWADRFGVSERVDALRAHGFLALGTYRIQELDGTLAVALAHPTEGWAATVIEKNNPLADAFSDEDSVGVQHQTDLFAHFHDTDERLIVSDSEDAAALPKVSGFLRLTDPKADTDGLMKKFRKKLGHHLVRPVRPSNFVHVFEEAYALEMEQVREELDLDNLVQTAGADIPPVDRDPAADAACAPVFQALASRDPMALQAALQSAPPLHGRDELGRTPLMAAVMTGEPTLAQTLLQAGADPNAYAPGDLDRPFEPKPTMGEVMAQAQAQDGEEMDPTAKKFAAGMQAIFGDATMGMQGAMTPLVLAIHGSNGPMISLLLQSGANPNGIGLEPSPLCHATERGELEAMGLLLQSGADPNHSTEDEQTPLFIAVSRGDGDAVQTLIQGGANVDEKDEDGDTALVVAGYEGAEDIFEILVPHAKKGLRKARKSLQESADPEAHPDAERLRRAASGDELSRLQRLLARGIPADSVGSSYDPTPLMSAAESGSENAARMLLQAGANPNYRGEDGETALARAARPGYVAPDRQVRMVRLLIDAGASLDLLGPEDRRFVSEKLGTAPQLPQASPAQTYPAQAYPGQAYPGQAYPAQPTETRPIPGAAEVAAYGQQPAYGQQQPAHGQQPAYGEQQGYAQQQPAYGQQPVPGQAPPWNPEG